MGFEEIAKACFIHDVASNNLEFIGRNIRTVRRDSGMTLAELANKIGIQEGPLGRIERGLNSPSARVVYRLSKVFDVSIDTLFAESEELFHQKKQMGAVQPYAVELTEPVVLSKKTSAKIQSILESVASLESLCGANTRAEIPLQVPFALSERGMARLAEKVRGYLGVDRGQTSNDWFQVFENNGLRTILFPFREDLAGFTYFDPASHRPVFFLNAVKTPESCLFKLAYELGSLYLWLRALNPALQAVDGETELELDRAAEKFAVELLLPEQALRTSLERVGAHKGNLTYELLLRLKHRSCVSAELFLRRLIQLDLVDATKVQQFNEKLKEFYRKSDAAEPSSIRFTRTPNAALWELLELATAEGHAEEAQKISEKFNRYALIRK